uniref:Kazrin, periplakin interacting protein n=1 Tax=Coturnix japonica TaxID=93934 RepID=A0A8C2SRY3_COTJA
MLRGQTVGERTHTHLRVLVLWLLLTCCFLLQEEVHLLRQMKEMLTKELEETHGSKSPEVLSATELKVQLAQKEQELARAKEALQAMKADRKRLKAEKTDLVSQMQQLYATLESREEQLRDFIRNYEQHRKESEDAVKALAKEKDLLEREKWELRRQAKEATDHASALRSQLDLKDNRMKELEAELAMAKQSLATLTKDVPKRHSLAMPGETVLNGNQEWVLQADLPLTAAIRQSQQTLYHSHPTHSADRQVRVSPCHSRQPSIISDASAAEGDRSSTPSDINSPRHRTHSLCNGDSPGPVQKNLHNPIVQSLEDLEDQKRKKKKEKMGFGSISRVFARGKQRKSLDPGLFDGTAPDYYIEEDADCAQSPWEREVEGEPGAGGAGAAAGAQRSQPDPASQHRPGEVPRRCRCREVRGVPGAAWGREGSGVLWGRDRAGTALWLWDGMRLGQGLVSGWDGSGYCPLCQHWEAQRAGESNVWGTDGTWGYGAV